MSFMPPELQPKAMGLLTYAFGEGVDATALIEAAHDDDPEAVATIQGLYVHLIQDPEAVHYVQDRRHWLQKEGVPPHRALAQTVAEALGH